MGEESVQGGLTAARVVIEATSPSGSVTLPGWRTKAIGRPVFNGLGGARADTALFELARDADADPFAGGPATATQVFTRQVQMPRVIAEVRRSESPDLTLYLGRDDNLDGQAAADEVLCVSEGSSWTEMCNLAYENPPQNEPDYWVLVHNVAEGGDGGTDEVQLLFGITSDAFDADAVQVSGPAGPIGEGEPFDIVLTWDFETLAPGDVAYTSFSIVDRDLTPGRHFAEVEVDIVRPFRDAYLYLPRLLLGHPAPELTPIPTP
jgi:hypothetical protein